MKEATRQNKSESDLRVTPQGVGKLLVEGAPFLDAAGPWKARSIDDQRLLVHGARGDLGVTQPVSSGSLKSLMYKNLLLGLIKDGWSGTLHVDTFHGTKRIYFFRGQIIFASSSIIDDRLGEILYRESRISIDQLTFAASQVTKVKRFGQVLVSKGVMTNLQLWQSLTAQVQHIVRSTFMVSHIYFEMQEDGPPPAAEVAMALSSREMIQEMFAYGVGFRGFLDQLASNSQVVPTKAGGTVGAAPLPMGTFLGDFMDMISSKPTIEKLLSASKLIDLYTIAAIYHIRCLGLCQIFPHQDIKHEYAPSLAPLRNKVEAYSFVLAAVKKAFQEQKIEFPTEDVRQFTRQHEKGPSFFIYLDEDLSLARDSISGIFSQCQYSEERTHLFEYHLESLIQFLFQLVGDHLQFSIAKQLRQEYRSVSG